MGTVTKAKLTFLQETRAPNVRSMVKEFNRLSALVSTEILDKKTPSGRAKVIACYIQVKSL